MTYFNNSTTPSSFWKKLNSEVFGLYLSRERVTIILVSDPDKLPFKAIIIDGIAIVHCIDEILILDEEEYIIV